MSGETVKRVEEVMFDVLPHIEDMAEETGSPLSNRDLVLIEAVVRQTLTSARLAAEGERDALDEAMTSVLKERTPFFTALLAEHPESFVSILVDAARAALTGAKE